MATKLDEAILEIQGNIEWECWVDKVKEGWWDTTEVLHCRLEWIADILKEQKDVEEHLETIEMVQKLLRAIESPAN